MPELQALIYFSTCRLTIRSCALEDVGWLHPLFREASGAGGTPFNGELSIDAMIETVEAPGNGYLVAGFDALGEAIGAMGMWVDGEGRHWVDVVVVPEYRHQGFGSELIRAWSHFFQQRNPSTSLYARVPSDALSAQKMLSRAGFVPQESSEPEAQVFRL